VSLKDPDEEQIEFDRRIAEIAELQHSLVTLSNVVAVGGTHRHATTRLVSGRWERCGVSVYRIAGTPATYESRVLASILSAGDGAVASHRCAARLLGVGFPTAPPEISIPRGRFHRPEGALVHTSTDLDRCRVVKPHGIPTTDAARTLLDLGRYIGPQALGRAVELGRRLELVAWSDLAACLATHARPGRHGVRRLRAVIAFGAANDEITDTDSELLALSLLREHGFGEPVLQHRVYDEEGRLLAEMDLAYLEHLVDFEVDGSVHLRPDVRANDEARDHDMRQRGWTVRRIWWEIPVRHPDEFVRIVHQTLKEAADKSRARNALL